MVFGGTSTATPIIAATYALAGTPAAGTYANSYPYITRTGLNDITSGSNGSCGGTYLCTGGPGYDGPTGLGTPTGHHESNADILYCRAAGGGPSPLMRHRGVARPDPRMHGLAVSWALLK